MVKIDEMKLCFLEVYVDGVFLNQTRWMLINQPVDWEELLQIINW